MKRSPLQRKTELHSKSELKRNSPLKSSKSKSKKRGAEALSKEFPESVKAIVRERSGNQCEKCGVRPLMHFHHCVFRSKGTACTPTLDNCLGLCVWCHTEEKDSVHKSRASRLWAIERARELAGR